MYDTIYLKIVWNRLERDRLAINEVLAALADDTRRKILLKLQEGKISSGDLAISLDMTPQALSYHLSKLKKADLIYETRYKNYIYYELNLSILDETIMWISNLRGDQRWKWTAPHLLDSMVYCLGNGVFLYAKGTTKVQRNAEGRNH